MKRLFAILATGIVLASCQKELSVDTGGNPDPNPGGGGGGGNTTGELLIRTVGKIGSETVTTEYEYNANKQLIREKITGTRDGMDMGNDVRIIRNNAGIITGFVQKNAMGAVQGLDSAVSRVYYDANAQRYTARVTDVTFMGFTTSDSAVYTYDAGGKITKVEGYIGSAGLGLPMEIMTVIEYKYGSGGITEVKMSTFDPNDPTAPLQVATQTTYTYDAKTNPMNLPLGEAVVIQREGLFGTANALTTDMAEYSTGTPTHFTHTLVYSYNTDNKPSTAVATENPGNKKINVSYFYK